MLRRKGHSAKKVWWHVSERAGYSSACLSHIHKIWCQSSLRSSWMKGRKIFLGKTIRFNEALARCWRLIHKNIDAVKSKNSKMMCELLYRPCSKRIMWFLTVVSRRHSYKSWCIWGQYELQNWKKLLSHRKIQQVKHNRSQAWLKLLLKNERRAWFLFSALGSYANNLSCRYGPHIKWVMMQKSES